jgi:hypothetical protein
MLDPGDFPLEIRHWIWAESNYGEPTDPDWYLLCQLENGLYAFYEDSTTIADFSGGWGSMSLYLAPEPESLIFFAMTDYCYGLYEQGTLPAPAWNSWDAETAERRLAWAMLGHARLGAAAWPWATAMGGDADTLEAVGQRVIAAAHNPAAAASEEDVQVQAMLQTYETKRFFDWLDSDQ